MHIFHIVTHQKLDTMNTFLGNQDTLSITSLIRDDAGTYQCEVENEVGLSNPETVTLIVECKYFFI